MSHSRMYIALAVDAHCSLPQRCYFCSRAVEQWGLQATGAVVHHCDHDRTNNMPGNLVFAHRQCHSRYHMLHEHPGNYERRAASIRVANSRADYSERGRAISATIMENAQDRRRRSQTIAAVNSRRRQCVSCSYCASPGAFGRYHKTCTRTGKPAEYIEIFNTAPPSEEKSKKTTTAATSSEEK